MKRFCLFFIALFTFSFVPNTTSTVQAQSEPFLGQLALVGFNFCPRGWLPAEGQILDIATNSALFSLYGTTYGGDGRTTFALPDLRGRVPISSGQGPGLENYPIGSKGGVESVTLTPLQMPTHSHTVTELTNSTGTTSGLVERSGGGEQNMPTTEAGNGLAHENRPPYLTMRWCVATVGIFPSRN